MDKDRIFIYKTISEMLGVNRIDWTPREKLGELLGLCVEQEWWGKFGKSKGWHTSIGPNGRVVLHIPDTELFHFAHLVAEWLKEE